MRPAGAAARYGEDREEECSVDSRPSPANRAEPEVPSGPRGRFRG